MPNEHTNNDRLLDAVVHLDPDEFVIPVQASHGDVPHYDVPHTDLPHMDTGPGPDHTDTAPVSITHADIPHVDHNDESQDVRETKPS